MPRRDAHLYDVLACEVSAGDLVLTSSEFINEMEEVAQKTEFKRGWKIVHGNNVFFLRDRKMFDEYLKTLSGWDWVGEGGTGGREGTHIDDVRTWLGTQPGKAAFPDQILKQFPDLKPETLDDWIDTHALFVLDKKEKYTPPNPTHPHPDQPSPTQLHLDLLEKERPDIMDTVSTERPNSVPQWYERDLAKKNRPNTDRRQVANGGFMWEFR
jgi:hypothetical protein